MVGGKCAVYTLRSIGADVCGCPTPTKPSHSGRQPLRNVQIVLPVYSSPVVAVLSFVQCGLGTPSEVSRTNKAGLKRWPLTVVCFQGSLVDFVFKQTGQTVWMHPSDGLRQLCGSYCPGMFWKWDFEKEALWRTVWPLTLEQALISKLDAYF